MNRVAGSLIAIVIVIAFLTPNIVLARSLNEEAALNLLLRTIEHDHVYDKRISLDCVTFGAEETTKDYFQFALRENHTEKCGGDPDVSPIVDRYRVYRASKKIEVYDAAKNSWRAYQGPKSN